MHSLPSNAAVHSLPSNAAVYSSIPETLEMDTSADESYYASPKPICKVIAVYDYDPQGNQELTLFEGVCMYVCQCMFVCVCVCIVNV